MKLFPNRKTDGRGTWILWRWSHIGDFAPRLTILRTPWFQILMHWIEKADEGPDLHCHPWAFFGFVLSGGYSEVVGTPCDDKLINTHFRKVDFITRKDTTTAHRIVAVEPSTKTLIFTGPKRKSWFFYEPLGKEPGAGDVLCMKRNWKERRPALIRDRLAP